MNNFLKSLFISKLIPFLKVIKMDIEKLKWLDYVTGYTTIETLSNINGVQKIKYTYSFGTAYRLIDTVNNEDKIFSDIDCTTLLANKKI